MDRSQNLLNTLKNMTDVTGLTQSRLLVPDNELPKEKGSDVVSSPSQTDAKSFVEDDLALARKFWTGKGCASFFDKGALYGGTGGSAEGNLREFLLKLCLVIPAYIKTDKSIDDSRIPDGEIFNILKALFILISKYDNSENDIEQKGRFLSMIHGFILSYIANTGIVGKI